MRSPRWLAATGLLAMGAAAHAEHFQYRVDLSGTYSVGGPEGCGAPGFDQPACPQPGTLTALLSFDTPGTADGAYLIADGSGDITDFTVDLGNLTQDSLFGGVNLVDGAPNGIVTAADQSEQFIFDWATRSASFTYNYGYHDANGNFTGTLSLVPEPGAALMLSMALAGMGWRQRARSARRSTTPAS